MSRASRLSAAALLVALGAAMPTVVAVPGLPELTQSVGDAPAAPVAEATLAPAITLEPPSVPAVVAIAIAQEPELARLALYPTLAKLAPGDPLPEPEARAIAAAVEAAVPHNPAPMAEPASLPFLREAQLPLPPPPLRGATSPAPAPPLSTAGRAVTLVPAAIPASGHAAEVAAGTAAALSALGLALYTRLSPSAVLRSPVRRALVEAIRRDPGCTAHALARVLALDDKTVRHHLRVLRRAGCVVGHGAPERLFVNGDMAPAAMRAAVATRAPSARALLDALGRGPARASDLARAARVHEATASVQLRRLAEAGIAVRRADGHWSLA